MTGHVGPSMTEPLTPEVYGAMPLGASATQVPPVSGRETTS